MIAQILRDKILAGEKMTTLQMCILLGWQGGTIHQVSQETKLSINQLLGAQK